jgi:hypothetical protein
MLIITLHDPLAVHFGLVLTDPTSDGRKLRQVVFVHIWASIFFVLLPPARPLPFPRPDSLVVLLFFLMLSSLSFLLFLFVMVIGCFFVAGMFSTAMTDFDMD